MYCHTGTDCLLRHLATTLFAPFHRAPDLCLPVPASDNCMQHLHPAHLPPPKVHKREPGGSKTRDIAPEEHLLALADVLRHPLHPYIHLCVCLRDTPAVPGTRTAHAAGKRSHRREHRPLHRLVETYKRPKAHQRAAATTKRTGRSIDNINP